MQLQELSIYQYVQILHQPVFRKMAEELLHTEFISSSGEQ